MIHHYILDLFLLLTFVYLTKRILATNTFFPSSAQLLKIINIKYSNDTSLTILVSFQGEDTMGSPHPPANGRNNFFWHIANQG